MHKATLTPYKILILDDKKGLDSWGNLTKMDIEDKGYNAIHVFSTSQALEKIREFYFDLLILDIDLGGDTNGILFQEQIRKLNFIQPIMFVTGNQDYLGLSIHNYTNAFASGPVVFFDKTTEDPDQYIKAFDRALNQALNRVDPIIRSLNILKEAGYGETKFTIRDDSFSVDDLLVPNSQTSEILRSLKESFQTLILEQFFSGD